MAKQRRDLVVQLDREVERVLIGFVPDLINLLLDFTHLRLHDAALLFDPPVTLVAVALVFTARAFEIVDWAEGPLIVQSAGNVVVKRGRGVSRC